MKHDPEKHHRQSVRLKGYDYAQAGAYFVTVCAWNRQSVFGDIIGGELRLNRCGEVVREEWLRTSQIRPAIVMDEFVVMPNHLHGILIITNSRGTLQCTPGQFGMPTSNSIPTIIRLFKSAVTKHLNELRGTLGVPVWQNNYYEHIIRNERSINHIRQYIVNNPLRWASDRENPQATSPEPDEAWRI